MEKPSRKMPLTKPNPGSTYSALGKNSGFFSKRNKTNREIGRVLASIFDDLLPSKKRGKKP